VGLGGRVPCVVAQMQGRLTRLARLAPSKKRPPPFPPLSHTLPPLQGGLHHGHSEDGSGWCPYDDIYLAVRRLRLGGGGAVSTSAADCPAGLPVHLRRPVRTGLGALRALPRAARPKKHRAPRWRAAAATAAA
jgi:hypothetical protein